jgi:hypothetical protein
MNFEVRHKTKNVLSRQLRESPDSAEFTAAFAKLQAEWVVGEPIRLKRMEILDAHFQEWLDTAPKTKERSEVVRSVLAELEQAKVKGDLTVRDITERYNANKKRYIPGQAKDDITWRQILNKYVGKWLESATNDREGVVTEALKNA